MISCTENYILSPEIQPENYILSPEIQPGVAADTLSPEIQPRWLRIRFRSLDGWYGGMIFTNQQVIWGMYVESYLGNVG